MKSRTYLFQNILFVRIAMMNLMVFCGVFLLPDAGRPYLVSLSILRLWINSTDN